MPIQTAIGRAGAAAGYAGVATHGALYSTVPGASAGTELAGGSPAYARKPLPWAGTNPITANVVFDVPSGATVAGGGAHNALTGGSYVDGGPVTSQPFSSQGTYALAYTYTQS